VEARCVDVGDDHLRERGGAAVRHDDRDGDHAKVL
jgi:hypothetical protein